MLAALVLLAVGGYSALRSQLSVGMDANLGADHPLVRQFDGFLERFGGGNPVLIAYECDSPQTCSGALDPAALEMAHAVARQLEQAPFVARVASVATTPIPVPSAELGLDARRLFVEGTPSKDPELRMLALADPLWSRTLLSADGRVGAIVVELAATESNALLSVVEEIRGALAPYEASFRFHLVGEAAIWVAAHEDGARSMLRIGVGTGGALFLILLLLLRSLPAVVASLATVGIAAGLTLGLVPWLGWQLSELTTGATTVILVDRLRGLHPLRVPLHRDAPSIRRRCLGAARHQPLGARTVLPDHRHECGLLRLSRERRALFLGAVRLGGRDRRVDGLPAHLLSAARAARAPARAGTQPAARGGLARRAGAPCVLRRSPQTAHSARRAYTRDRRRCGAAEAARRAEPVGALGPRSSGDSRVRLRVHASAALDPGRAGDHAPARGADRDAGCAPEARWGRE